MPRLRSTVLDAALNPDGDSERWRLIVSLNDICQRFGYSRTENMARLITEEYARHLAAQAERERDG